MIGILFFDKAFFIKATTFNILLMFLLVIYTQQELSPPFILFIVVCFFVGMTSEIIGTNTGTLFGNYEYGNVFGPMVKKVPLLIGINWFLIIYCSGVSMHHLLNSVLDRLSQKTEKPRQSLKAISLIVDGATAAVFFDWLMEPVAVKLGYWKWAGDGSIPFYNYVCWFVISLLLLFVFARLGFRKRNKFAVHLLLIQAMFFLLLRTFL